MKNKFNRCCCDDVEPPSECTICSNNTFGKATCVPNAVDENISIIDRPHPDKDLPGFVSQGRVFGRFALGNEEAEFWILFDYQDTGNYYAVVIKPAPFDEELEVRIVRVVGGVEAELASRIIWVEQVVFLWEGFFCISWKPGEIFADVEIVGNGGTLTAVKGTDFFSGFVGTMNLGQSSGHIQSFYRGPGEVTDEGTCPECSPIVAGRPCDCCPDGIAASWLVDTTGFNLSNGDMEHCNILNDQLFVLDRINVPCTADYSQLILNSACFGSYHTRLTILLVVFRTGSQTCTLRITITLDPITPAADPVGPCGFTLVLCTYEKTVTSGILALCSGSHTLTKVQEELGVFEHCKGSLPNTIQVESF